MKGDGRALRVIPVVCLFFLNAGPTAALPKNNHVGQENFEL